MKGTSIFRRMVLTLSLPALVALLAVACFNIVLEEPRASVEGPRASVEGPPASAEDTPALVEDTLALVEDILASVEDIPASVEDTPASVEDTPASVEDTPASVEDTPALNGVMTVMAALGDGNLLSEPQSSYQETYIVDVPELDSVTDIFVPTLPLMPDPLTTFRLTVNGVPAIGSMLVLEGGTVEVSLPPRETGGLYWGGDRIHLSAIPQEGYQFDAWGGDCFSDGNVCILTIDGNRDLSAGFLPSDEFFVLDLVALPDGGGEVQVQPPPNAPDGKYLAGTHLELIAIDSEGFGFIGWDGACVGEEKECQIVMISHKSVTASFAPDFYTLTINRVLVDGAGVSVGHGQIAVFPFVYATHKGFARSAIVTLTVDPDAGYVVVDWGGDCSEVQPDGTECTLNMDGDKLVEVTFAEEAADRKS